MKLQKYKNPARKFRAAPFWSWNDKLEPSLLRYQVREMSRVGLGGYFMHARGGISTPYMGEEWMEAFQACIDEGKKTGMQSWGYDEEGYPSGFAGGAVQARGREYWSKWLARDVVSEYVPAPDVVAVYDRDGGKLNRDAAAHGDGIVVLRLCDGPGYVDVFDPKTTAAFLEETHERYYARFGEQFGREMPGFFTDEPQFGNMGVPWTNHMAEEFAAAYDGADVTDGLFWLYNDAPAGDAFRYRFWKLLNRLYTQNFIRQMGDWCRAHGCKLTGHVMGEDNLMSQMHSTGGCMPAYEYFGIPGIDWLGRGIGSDLLPKQVSSVAAQLGKRQVLSEMFGLTGWDVKPSELKWIAEWQFVNGISYMCQHLEGYTLRGLRKRDYPPSLFYQLPWWPEYKTFNDYFGRLSQILTEGREEAPVLLLHNITSAWARFNFLSNDSLFPYQNSLEHAAHTLASHQIGWHLGDETILAAHGAVKNGELRVGRGRYRAVVLPALANIESATLRLLRRFVRAGGRIFATGELPRYVDGKPYDGKWLRENTVYVPDGDALVQALAGTGAVQQTLAGENTAAVRVMRRRRPAGEGANATLLYVVNISPEQTASFRLETAGETMTRLDMENVRAEKIAYTVEESRGGAQIAAEITLAPASSVLLAVDVPDVAAEAETVPVSSDAAHVVTIPQTLRIAKRSENALTLDACEYRVDGGEWMPKRAVILLVQDLLKLQRPCDVELRYTFTVDCDPAALGRLYMAAETVNAFDMRVNGNPVCWNGKDWWVDSAFQKCEITGMVQRGENTVTLRAHFWQSQTVYDVLFGNDPMGTGFNKLTYDTELESIYIVGSFGVYSKNGFTAGERNALFAADDFYIAEAPETVRRGSVTEQGFAFFAGRMTFAFTETLPETMPDGRVCLRYSQRAAVTHITVNGKPVRTVCWEPYETDITDFVHPGENRIEIEAVSGNRCLLGPHHHIEGETYFPGPSSFTDVGGWPERENCGKPIWRDGWCVVTFGIE